MSKDFQLCGNCLFAFAYQAVGEEVRYVCRRYPPTIVHYREPLYPDTANGNWCGEWKQDPDMKPPGPSDS